MTGPSSSKPGLLRHSIFMFVATQIANLANMLFQVIALRKLDNVQYGVLAAMLSIYLVASTPMDALRTAMAHFTTRAVRTGDVGHVRWVVRSWCARLGWLSALFLLTGYFGRHFAEDFFQLETGLPFLITTVLIASTFFLLLFAGVFQGMQHFYWMSASMHLWIVFRVGFAYVLLLAIPTAMYALAAHGIASVIGILISLYGLYVLTRGRAHEKPANGIGVYFLRSIVMLGCYAVLMNADLIFVKHFFHPEEAGVFAKAAIIGRAVIFLPMPIALVMFPKVISAGPSTRESRVTLVKALALVGALVGTAVGVIVAFPWLPLWIMADIRNPDPAMIRLLIWVVCAMAPLTVTYLLINYEMAQHRFGMTWALVLCAALYIAGAVLWHDSVYHIVYVLAAVSLLSALLFTFAILLRAGRRRRGPPPDVTASTGET